MIDNNDSFTYNLVQILEENDCIVDICRYRDLNLQKTEGYSGIIISPGPGIPNEYKLIFDFLSYYSKKIKILGVCLGHQIIGEFFGGKNYQLSEVHHGENSKIRMVDDSPLYKGISKDNFFYAGRYHSWSLNKEFFPSCLRVTALDEEGVIMSFDHKSLPVFGVQFHPESIMTPQGEIILKNWINF